MKHYIVPIIMVSTIVTTTFSSLQLEDGWDTHVEMSKQEIKDQQERRRQQIEMSEQAIKDQQERRRQQKMRQAAQRFLQSPKATLFEAIDLGNIYAVEALLDRGHNVNEKDSLDGNSLLHQAVIKDHLDIMNLLLNRGANVNATNKKGVSALQIAINIRNINMIQILLNRGANVNQQDNYGESPLQWAIRKNDINIVKLLFNNGANINQTNKKGESALDTAMLYPNYPATITFLSENGGKVNAPQQISPEKQMLDAIEQNKLEVVQQLIDDGYVVQRHIVDFADKTLKTLESKEPKADAQAVRNARNIVHFLVDAIYELPDWHRKW